MYLFVGFRSLIRRDSAKFEKKFMKIFEIERLSWVKVLLSSVALKLEITVLFGMLRDLRDYNNSLSLPIVSESFSSKNTCLFDVTNFEASYLAFLYNSVYVKSGFFEFLKTLSFSKTSLSNHFWEFPFTPLILFC